jgi:2-polyprenyl-6-methoxyphenol hydroxylase-like FAD-dependent oxidoreductase
MAARSEMMEQQKKFGCAVVIGGSVAGLVASRVLADYFERVVLIERDWRPNQPALRKGAPHASHAHSLLAKGDQLFNRYFPGLRRALIEGGAVPMNVGHDVLSHGHGLWRSRFDSPLETFGACRSLFEHALSNHLRHHRNIICIDGCSVRKLDYRDGKISGVYLQSRSPRTNRERLAADLVVDATGRESSMPAQLVDCGYERPEESSTIIDLVSASRLYRIPAGKRDWKSVVVSPEPPNRRGATVIPVEGGRWLVTLFGMHSDVPPIDDAGFLRYARDLPIPDVYYAIRDAEPVSDITRMETRNTVRRHYERLKRFPEGLLVIGDALGTTNPLHGQGMSVAALHADALQQCLEKRLQSRSGLKCLWRSFFASAAQASAATWQLATGEDFRDPHTLGQRSAFGRLLQGYMERMELAAGHDPQVAATLFSVRNLLEPRRALFAPSMLRRVLFFKKSRAQVHHAASLPAFLDAADQRYVRPDRIVALDPTTTEFVSSHDAATVPRERDASAQDRMYQERRQPCEQA